MELTTSTILSVIQRSYSDNNNNNNNESENITITNSYNMIVNVTDNDNLTAEMVASDEESLTLPPEFLNISQSSLNCIIAYTFLFLFAAGGNLNIFLTILCNKFFKNKKRLYSSNNYVNTNTTRIITGAGGSGSGIGTATGSSIGRTYSNGSGASSCANNRSTNSKYYSKIAMLIFHLSIADLIVTFFLIPMEIFWRYTVQWIGGNILCKTCQFGRAFGLYLSSMIIICISLDRYFAIMFPLKLIDGQKRIKKMLIVAWIAAALFSLPQTFIFSVKSHPVYPSFQQCVSIGFFETQEQEMLYNVFSLTAMYFVPFAIIIFTYTSVLWKIARKAKQQQQIAKHTTNALRNSSRNSPISVISSNSATTTTGLTASIPQVIPELSTPKTSTAAADAGGFLNIHRLITWITSSSASNNVGHQQQKQQHRNKTILTLRTSDNAIMKFSRARTKTLKLTLVIVLIFFISAVPYVVMTLWYMFDRESALQVDDRIQDGFFMMVVANSCMNPIIYGSFSKGCSGFWLCNLFELCFSSRRSKKSLSSKDKSNNNDNNNANKGSNHHHQHHRQHNPALLTLSASPAPEPQTTTTDYYLSLKQSTNWTKLTIFLRKFCSCINLRGYFHNNLILTQHQTLNNQFSVNTTGSPISSLQSPFSINSLSTVISEQPMSSRDFSTAIFVG